jgi:nucleotide-binding universal stress UspA family protein
LRTVLVATDLAPSSDKAVRYAAALARRYGSKFYLMNVVSSLGYTIAGPQAAATAADLALREARQKDAELKAAGYFDHCEHQVVVVTGEVWSEVQSVIEQEKIDLLVVGTHSRGGLAKVVLGSVAEQIFRHASCPVLTVGPHSPRQEDTIVSDSTRPILFATDFSTESMAALPYAISYANRRNCQLVLMHVHPPVPEVIGNRWYTAGDVVEMGKKAKDIAKQKLLALIAPNELKQKPVAIVRTGVVEEAIVQTADELHALGIAIGLKPHGDVAAHLRWSTAYNIVCRATCPVLTVRS